MLFYLMFVFCIRGVHHFQALASCCISPIFLLLLVVFNVFVMMENKILWLLWLWLLCINQESTTKTAMQTLGRYVLLIAKNWIGNQNKCTIGNIQDAYHSCSSLSLSVNYGLFVWTGSITLWVSTYISMGPKAYLRIVAVGLCVIPFLCLACLVRLFAETGPTDR